MRPDKAIDRYIPAWLDAHKNEWVSGHRLNRLFVLERGGKFFAPANVARTHNWPGVKHAIKRGAKGYAILRRVKDVLAKAKAHEYVVREYEGADKSNPSAFVLRVPDLSAVKKRELQIAKLQTELADQTKLFEDAKKMVRSALSAQPIDDRPGVYFLCSEDAIVYVGMSVKSVKDRVNGRINLVALGKMIPCSDPALCASLEKMWIRFLNPPGNANLKSYPRGKTPCA